MSASAAATIIFHHLDPATEPAVRELLVEQSFLPWFGEPMTATLHTNTGYGHLHADLDVCTRMGHAIRELDPGAVFEICQDPGENIAGQRIVFHPNTASTTAPAPETAPPCSTPTSCWSTSSGSGPRWTPAPTPPPPSMVSTAPPAGPGPATCSAATASTARTTRADGQPVTHLTDHHTRS